jgi:hypothetical protein
MNGTSVAPSLHFDASSHRYRLGARELPSVTAVLHDAGLVDDRWFSEETRDRGTGVHLALELLDRGERVDVRPEWSGYVRGYQSFLAVARPSWELIEHRICDETLGYAGCLDRAGVLTSTGTRCVLDIKTGAVPAWVGAQLAAYRRCLPNSHTWSRMALQLSADGTFRLHPLTERQDERTFLAALHLAQWKRAHR